MVLSSTVLYFLEHDAQPQNVPDIPATMWWAVLVMTPLARMSIPLQLLGRS
jgi:voltage-gated potassium channel